MPGRDADRATRQPELMTAPASAAPRGRRLAGGRVALLAILAYVPLLLTSTGKVSADTKQYLYLDPSRLLARAASMWDPNVALGTVTHQNIGYLFPAGPFYWFFDQVGVPDWIAQRLWLGSILFGAGLGVLFLLRTLAMRGPGVVVAALVYMLSPYSLQYASRLSILLLAWAALPWMVAITARALRDGGWRYPAMFAVVVQVAGSVNATALVFVGIAPVLWVLHAVWVACEVPGRRAVGTVARIGLLTTLASLWWIVGLAVQSGYGLDVLRYTETVSAVATAGLAGEVMRGLGYWFFYGGDKLGPWIESSIDYTQRRFLIGLGYLIPVFAMIGAAFIRWRHRAYFIALVFIGVVIAVGAYPYDDPSPFGVALKDFSESSTVGLALRSVGRAVPLVVLGVAVLLGTAVSALAGWLELRRGRMVALAMCAAVGILPLVNVPALWGGTFYGTNLLRDEQIPSYWTEAIAALDRRSHDTRIIELPGSDFTNYTWGGTVEPITPGLTDRPYVARELIPYGSAPSADLLSALDRRIQLRLIEPDAVAAVARLLSAGDIVVRNDLETARYDLVRPREMQSLFTPQAAGLGEAREFGPPIPPSGGIDSRELANATAPDPASVVVIPVDDPRPIVRVEAGDPIAIVSGDGEGVVDLAEAGLIRDGAAFQYTASYARRPRALASALDRGAVLIVTDTNRKRARRWDTVSNNLGFTETAASNSVDDPFDRRLDLFPGAGVEAFTVMEQHRVEASASGYGMASRYLPADRPSRAFDGNAKTAWRVGAFANVLGEHIRATLDDPMTADEVTLVQPLTGSRDRFITKVRLRFNDARGDRIGPDETVVLGPESRTPAGQLVPFERRRFSSLDITIVEDNVGEQPSYPHESAVGFAEIQLHDEAAGTGVAHVDEVVQMPTDLVGLPEVRNRDHVLVYEMTRLRSVIAPPNIAEEEPNLVRRFEVPTPREFGVVGTARVAATAPDELIDRTLGIAGADAGGITARSSERLLTTLDSRASSALDGDRSTAWTTEVGAESGQWIEIETPDVVRFDRLDLSVVTDGRHSVPTRLRIDAGGETRVVHIPPLVDIAAAGATTDVPVTFPALTGSRVRVTVEEVQPVRSAEYYSNLPIVLPTGIAELGLAGVERPEGGAASWSECRDDLLTIDGTAVPLRVAPAPEGTGEGLVLRVAQCSPAEADAPTIELGAGSHVLRSSAGSSSGIDLDRIVLASAAGGSALALEGRAVDVLASPGGPRVADVHLGRTEAAAEVREVDGPFWLVLGESLNRGWRAEADGVDLGPPQLVDGMSNGWLVKPGRASTVVVSMTWAPQRWVWLALAVSAATVLACLGIVGVAWHRRRPTRRCEQSTPTLGSPWTWSDDRTGLRASAGTAVVLAILGGVFVGPTIGGLVGGATLVVMLRPRLRWLLTVGAPSMLAAAGGYVIIQQTRNQYPAVFEWPTFFESIHDVAWLGVVLLVADAVIEVVRSRRAPGH